MIRKSFHFFLGKVMLTFGILSLTAPGYGQSFVIPAAPSMKTNEAHQLAGPYYILTSMHRNTRGAIWSADRINLDMPFEQTFFLFFGGRNGFINVPQSDQGADGIAFVLQNMAAPNSTLGTPIGAYGGYLGYGDTLGVSNVVPEAITNSISVEFDTYYNSNIPPDLLSGDQRDTAKEIDHIDIFRNGNMSTRVIPSSIPVPTPNNELEHADVCYRVRVRWFPDNDGNADDTSKLEIFFGDNMTTPVLTLDTNIRSADFINDHQAWWGFTAGTKNAYNLQYVVFLDEPDTIVCGDSVVLGNSLFDNASTPQITYTWTKADGTFLSNTRLYTARESGRYVISMQYSGNADVDSNGTFSTYTTPVISDTVDVRLESTLADPGSSRTICKGAYITLGNDATFNPLLENTYSWYKDFGIAPVHISTVSSIYIDNPTTETHYTLIVTSKSGRCADTNEVTVRVMQPPIVEPIEQKVCKNAEFTIDGSFAVDPAYSIPHSYKWYKDGVLVSTGSTITDITDTVRMYTLCVSPMILPDDLENPSCATTCVEVKATPYEVTIDAGPDLYYCRTNGHIILGPTITDANRSLYDQYNFQWTSIITSVGPYPGPNPGVSPTVTTTYPVIIKMNDIPGCVKYDEVTVNVSEIISFNAGSDKYITCTSGPVVLGADLSVDYAGDASLLCYNWGPAAGLPDYYNSLDPFDKCSSRLVFNVNPSSTTVYTVTVTDKAGCTKTDGLVVYVNETMNIDNNNVEMCLGETRKIGFDLSEIGTPRTVKWEPDTDLSCVECETPDVTPTALGTHKYIATITVGSCEEKDTIFVNVVSNGGPFAKLYGYNYIPQSTVEPIRNGSRNDVLNDIKRSPDSCSTIVTCGGSVNPYGNSDAAFMKINADGTWDTALIYKFFVYTCGRVTSEAKSIAIDKPTRNGAEQFEGYVLTGNAGIIALPPNDTNPSSCATVDEQYSNSGEHYPGGLFILKTFPNGQPRMWREYTSTAHFNQVILSGNSITEGYKIKQTKDGGYIVIGSTRRCNLCQIDAFIIKVRNDLTLEWSRIYDWGGNDNGADIMEWPGGGYVAVGTSLGGTSTSGSLNSIVFMRLDSNGWVTHIKQYTSALNDNLRAASMDMDISGNIAVLGETKNANTDIVLFRVDSSGTLISGTTKQIGVFPVTGRADSKAGNIICNRQNGTISLSLTNIAGTSRKPGLIRLNNTASALQVQNLYEPGPDENITVFDKMPNGDYILGSTRRKQLNNNTDFEVRHTTDWGVDPCYTGLNTYTIRAYPLVVNTLYYSVSDSGSEFNFYDLCIPPYTYKDSTACAGHSKGNEDDPTILEGTATLYPNPIHRGEKLNVRYTSSGNRTIQCLIIDAMGRTCLKHEMLLNEGLNNLVIETPGLNPGVYFLRLENETPVAMSFTVIE